MSRLILHIGMHKTGSSSLQRFFSRNRTVLSWAGIDYPPVVSPSGRSLPKQNDLFLALSHEKDREQPHPFYGSAAAVIERLAARVEECPVTVVSAEGLSGEFDAFAEAFVPLRNRFPIRVVVFLRRQDHWATSFYRQMVLSDEVRERRRFSAFLADPDTQRHLDYADLIGRWERALGRDAIRIEVFPPMSSLLGTFLKAADLPAWLRLLPHGGTRLNKRVPDAHLLPLLGEEKVAAIGFNDEARQAFLTGFEDGNEWIRRRFRPDLPKLFTREM